MVSVFLVTLAMICVTLIILIEREFKCSASFFIFMHIMETRKNTAVSEFLLQRLPEVPQLQPFLFCLFLSMYLVTIVENLLIILAVNSHSSLHNCIYSIFSNLFLNDICLSIISL
jgi:hypothetical protein